jgi:hypothetical protein
MVKEITKYKTNDDVEYETRDEAVLHEVAALLSGKIAEWEGSSTSCYYDMTIYEFTPYILKHWSRIKTLLKEHGYD